jgi:RNase E specificity factor CsrD
MKLPLRIFKLWLIYSIVFAILAHVGINRFLLSESHIQRLIEDRKELIEPFLDRLPFDSKFSSAESVNQILSEFGWVRSVLVLESSQPKQYREQSSTNESSNQGRKTLSITHQLPALQSDIQVVVAFYHEEDVLSVMLWLLAVLALAQPLFYLLIKKVFKPWEMEISHQNASARAICYALGKEPGGHPPVSIAFDAILEKLQELKEQHAERAEKRREHSFIDSMTGLGNRTFFDARLDILLHELDSFTHGAVILINFSALEELVDEDRHQEFESFMQNIASVLKQLAADDEVNQVLARRADFDFAILLHQVTPKQASGRAGKLLKQFRQISIPRGVDETNYVHMGIACYQGVKTAYDLLAEADMALRTAQLQGPNNYYMYTEGELDNSKIRGSVRWRSFLERVINQRVAFFHFQPIMCARESRVIHYEALVRIEDDGEMIRAATFIPMVAKCGFSVKFDRMALEILLSQFVHDNTLQNYKLSINISSESFLDHSFMEWICSRIEQHPELANRLIVELSEYAIHKNLNEMNKSISLLSERGCSICVDHVGQHLGSSEYIQFLPIQYLKLHNSIVRNINHVPENQQFVDGIVDIVQDQEIQILAEGVETQQEWDWLRAAGIVAGQGYLFCEPKSIEKF